VWWVWKIFHLHRHTVEVVAVLLEDEILDAFFRHGIDWQNNTIGPLFTSAADTIDFNDPIAGTYVDGTQFDALDGNDVVTLPDSLIASIASGYDATLPLNEFNGGAGNDTINGGSLDDTIAGGEGNDALSGGPGSDLLTGGPGIDVSTGGLGSDIFEFAPGDGVVLFNDGATTIGTGDHDSIPDFASGLDTIDISDYGFGPLVAGANFFSISGQFNGTNAGVAAATPYAVVDGTGTVYHDDDSADPGYTVVTETSGDNPVNTDFVS